MIVEDERDTYNDIDLGILILHNINVDYDHIDEEILNIDVFHGTHPDFVAYLQTRHICIQEEFINNFNYTLWNIFENILVTTMMKFNFCCQCQYLYFFFYQFYVLF